MAAALVPAIWVANNWLPNTCARHEAVATRRIKRDFYTKTPAWLLPVFLLALLLALIIALAMRTTVKGQLPACERCGKERRTFLAYAWGSWGAATVLWGVAVYRASGVVALLATVVTLAAIVVSVLGDRFRVTGVVSKDRRWVELKGTSEGFSRAVAEALQGGQPAVPSR